MWHVALVNLHMWVLAGECQSPPFYEASQVPPTPSNVMNVTDDWG